ncbi:hypothetical protein D3C87_1354650 [compost metagenome]
MAYLYIRLSTHRTIIVASIARRKKPTPMAVVPAPAPENYIGKVTEGADKGHLFGGANVTYSRNINATSKTYPGFMTALLNLKMISQEEHDRELKAWEDEQEVGDLRRKVEQVQGLCEDLGVELAPEEMNKFFRAARMKTLVAANDEDKPVSLRTRKVPKVKTSQATDI